MVLLEGGAFRCDLHDFTTMEIEEWNTHCFGNPEHLEAGSTPCRTCGVIVEFTGLPFAKLQPDGTKNISLQCENCEKIMMGTVKRSKSQ